jgi:hypothetical protein
VSRLRALIAEGRLEGVLDDRGRFVALSAADVRAVEAWMVTRGRVTLRELGAALPALLHRDAAVDEEGPRAPADSAPA